MLQYTIVLRVIKVSQCCSDLEITVIVPGSAAGLLPGNRTEGSTGRYNIVSSVLHSILFHVLYKSLTKFLTRVHTGCLNAVKVCVIFTVQRDMPRCLDFTTNFHN